MLPPPSQKGSKCRKVVPPAHPSREGSCVVSVGASGGAAQPAGDARFLILPHLRVPHLASAILGRITRRLPADWQNTYGYTPVLAQCHVA